MVREFMMDFLDVEPFFGVCKFNDFSFVSLLCCVLMYDYRFLIISLGCCLRGVWLVYNGIVWAICICGIGVIVSFVVPFVASEYAMSFPFILVWALTFWMVMLCQNHFMCCIIDAIGSLSRWLCWENGHLM